ncbi:MAG: hypothetical protein ACYCZJ_05110 [Sulfuriferula sp.]
MHRAGIFKSSVLIDVVNYAGLPLLAIYGFSMFAYPWISGSGSWQHVQAVWDRWQSLNAAAIAFVASLVAFNISKFNESRQRERDFVAAKAFLPSTFSGLMEYCSRSARIYSALWERDGKTPLVFEHPDLPQGYREVFSNCIRHADPSVGSYLSNILVRLQVHDARLRDAIGETTKGLDRVVGKHTLIAYVLRLGELYALMGNLFGFARGEESFQAKSLTWEDFRNAYSILDLEVDEFVIDESMNLQAFTKRWIERAKSQTAAGEK